MSNINTILAKHFDGESTQDELQLVEQFKSENPEEYQLLKAAWVKKPIKAKSYNSAEEWRVVKRRATSAGKSRQSSLRPLIAIALFLLLGLLGTYYLSQKNSVEMIHLASNEDNQKVILDDGTIVHLKENALLTYPKKFGDESREVSLKGDAFFEVSKDATRPFRIAASHSNIEVLGTSFNVSSAEDETEVAVATGKVSVTSTNSSKNVVLTPNQTATVTTENLEVKAGNNQNFLSWKTGFFQFDKTSISEAVTNLNTYYDDKIVLLNKESDCLFSTSIKSLSIEEVIEIIQLTCNLSSTSKKGIYELH